MYLLFKLIKSLKEPKLSKNEWGLLNSIYSSLPEKKFIFYKKQFLQSISDKTINFENENSDAILEFIRCWFIFTNELSSLDEMLNKTKIALYSSPTPLSDQDKNIIILQLLPSSIDLLRQALNATELFSRIYSIQPEIAQLIRQFLYTISLRLHQLGQQAIPSLPHTAPTEQLDKIIYHAYNYILVNKLVYLCHEYSNSINKSALFYLKENDSLGYLYYSNYAFNISRFLAEEIQSIEFDAEHVKLTPIFYLFLQKYSQADDLVKTLIRDKLTNEEKLNEFSQKFEVYRPIFELSSYDDGVFFKTIIYSDITLEKSFINDCSLVADQIQSRLHPPTPSLRHT